MESYVEYVMKTLLVGEVRVDFDQSQRSATYLTHKVNKPEAVGAVLDNAREKIDFLRQLRKK